MAHYTIDDRTLALAGVFQAAGLVHQSAHRGTVEAVPYAVSINSIFIVDPVSTRSVYGNTDGLHYGLQLMMDQLSGDAAKRNVDIVKYLVGMVHLERQLNKRPALLRAVRLGIEKARIQSLHFSLTHDNTIAGLANCYLETISTLIPRLIVRGEPGYLTNTPIANRIRALLLAGIRSAVLWRQCGGNRRQLLFRRSRLLETAGRLLERG